MRRPVAQAAATLVAAAVLAGCGDARTDEQEVAATVRSFARASAEHDYGALCRRILAPKLVDQVTSIGLPCRKALARGLGNVRDPRLAIGAITVDGEHASVEVRTSAADQEPSKDTLQLVKVRGDWRIASLAQ